MQEGGVHREASLPNPTEEGPVVSASAPAPEIQQGTHRILMVEDNPSDAWLISHLLGSHSSFTLDHAETLSRTRALLRSQRYDAVLLDLTLPDGNETETLREVAPFAEHVPIVALTGVEDEDLARACIATGIQDYVYKSDLSGGGLARSLNHAISRHRASEVQRRIESAERQISLGQVAGGVLHEINNLATIVLSNLENAQHRLGALRPHLSAVGHPTLDEILASFEEDIGAMSKMTAIAAELRLFSRGDASDDAAADLDETVRRTLRLLEGRLRLRAHIHCDLGGVSRVAADEGKLSQVLINLLLNAADALDESESSERSISISTSVEGRFATLRVADTGCGIRLEDQQRVFEPFFTSKPLGRGSGLGLSVCSGLVASWGGSIRVESEPDRGTCFSVTLPLNGRPRPASQPAAPRPTTTPTRCKILLVDDLDAPRRALRRLIQRHHDVVEASSGADALEILRSRSFDVVLCDMMMPEMSGVEFYERARILAPDLESRFIFLTGGAFTEDARAALDASRLPVLPKPVTRAALLEAIDTATRSDS